MTCMSLSAASRPLIMGSPRTRTWRTRLDGSPWSGRGHAGLAPHREPHRAVAGPVELVQHVEPVAVVQRPVRRAGRLEVGGHALGVAPGEDVREQGAPETVTLR